MFSTNSKKNDSLSTEVYQVTQQGVTERPFTGKYYQHKDSGIYHCICCQKPLFSSQHKYDSGSGWPSYWQAVSPQVLKEVTDHSHGMLRIEVCCANCNAHLGHVFEDGPQPTGLRYCINSVALNFSADDDMNANHDSEEFTVTKT